MDYRLEVMWPEIFKNSFFFFFISRALMKMKKEKKAEHLEKFL